MGNINCYRKAQHNVQKGITDENVIRKYVYNKCYTLKNCFKKMCVTHSYRGLLQHCVNKYTKDTNNESVASKKERRKKPVWSSLFVSFIKDSAVNRTVMNLYKRYHDKPFDELICLLNLHMGSKSHAMMVAKSKNNIIGPGVYV